MKDTLKTRVATEKTLTKLAKGAADILMKYYLRVHRIEKKEAAGIVTEADKYSEEFLVKKIKKAFPGSSIIAEESGEEKNAGSEWTWIIDPLDGTSNYAHGFPWFCVSIGLYRGDKPHAGIIYQPVTKEMFFGMTGKGAYLNQKRIRVSKTAEIGDSLLGTGFYYTTGTQLESEMQIFRRIQERALGVRRPGSAALDMAYVACGRYEGFWERGLASWDVAAGAILVSEAGGRLTNYEGEPMSVFGREVVATNGKVHTQILQLMQHTH